MTDNTEMTDICDRLRDNAAIDEAEGANPSVVELEREAADMIEDLRRRLAKQTLTIDILWRQVHRLTSDLDVTITVRRNADLPYQMRRLDSMVKAAYGASSLGETADCDRHLEAALELIGRIAASKGE
jgi:hypothetical protein